ncbi:hypothetical protein IMSAGC001_04025 [Bacteroides acidifaciens]|uniref:Uncharacterized protein n=1 Tax=Bacteroides acidifaciens TaxID=85831 RepID=A0A7J0A8X3_9BACE|nr:hypothetical protein IMSAGC001_04025 [Bacteroides acidifaciens]
MFLQNHHNKNKVETALLNLSSQQRHIPNDEVMNNDHIANIQRKKTAKFP